MSSYTESMKKKMESNTLAFRQWIRKIRTGRANPALLESVMVLYYGNETPLSQISQISISSPRTLMISPWDNKALKDIEQAIVRANLGLNPENDGRVIRLNLPELTEERRKELVKELKKKGEKYRVDVRNSRRAAMEELKKAVKEKEMSEDEQKKLSGEIQKTTDQFIDQIEQILTAKEKEIMEI